MLETVFKPGFYVGKIPDDLGFYCFPTVPLEIIDIPDRLGSTGTNLANRERFYFPDTSQTGFCNDDHSQQMKTQICTVGDVGDGFAHYQSTKLLKCCYICVQVSIFGALSISRQIHNRKSGTGLWQISDISTKSGWSTKSKIPDRLGFS